MRTLRPPRVEHIASAACALSAILLAADARAGSGLTEAEPCQWPTAVGFTGTRCSGALVHRELVVSAASCLLPYEMPYGERLPGGAGSCDPETDGTPCSPVGGCKRHPRYDPETGANDIQYCWVFAPPEGMAMTPPAVGCEAEMLQPGTAVTIAGFGANLGSAAIKEAGPTTIVEMNELTMNAGGDGIGQCENGDRGGPAFVEMPDGSWRVAGVFSAGGTCGEPGTYVLIAPYAAWIEDSAGLDITPCHDSDGAWNPGPNCGGFATAPGEAHGGWDDWCSGGELSEPSQLCGPPYDPAADDGGSDGGSGDGSGDTTDGGDDRGDTASVGDGGDETEATDTDSASSGDLGFGDDASGCACSNAASPPWAFAAFLLGLFGRRCASRR